MIDDETDCASEIHSIKELTYLILNSFRYITVTQCIEIDYQIPNKHVS